jgi:PPM family protein phosphatase
MSVTAQWRSGVATDPGLVRPSNEDRYWIDNDRGIFLVVDGVGGHASGEIAADTAVEVIREQLAQPAAAPEETVRRAIAAANNRIYEMSQGSPDLEGMACVLTLAVVDDGEMVIGHVGDSRLYLIWNGGIRKLTSDHSPVGEAEDAGVLTEEEAMLDPRRNQVFRGVGTRPRHTADEYFVETRRCRFKPDAAFLLCSDGLSDLLPAAALRQIAERYDGDPARVARDLVNAANEAGGPDNITALFVAGEEFRPRDTARSRRSTTRRLGATTPRPRRLGRLLSSRPAFLVYGMILAAVIWAVLKQVRVW